MKIEKLTLGDTQRIGPNLNVIKITYVQSKEYEKLDLLNERIAQNLFEYAKNNLQNIGDGNVVVLLTPTLTYVDEGVISIKYDFTVTSNMRILHHKRFCVNMLYKSGLLLLPCFLDKHKYIHNSTQFYLNREDDGGLLAVPVIRSLQVGTVVGRRSEIDTYCDGAPQKIQIKIPHFLTDKKMRKNKK